jgi:hypothetical protein
VCFTLLTMRHLSFQFQLEPLPPQILATLLIMGHRDLVSNHASNLSKQQFLPYIRETFSFFFVRNTNLPLQFRELIDVYSENHMKQIYHVGKFESAYALNLL